MAFYDPIKSNLHTHTRFCDGKDTPEEIVQAAIAQGLETIGFSGHSFVPFDPEYCMSHEGELSYRAEIERLRASYASRIKILLGIEQDYYSTLPPLGCYDYIIGSVHYLNLNGEYCPIDLSVEMLTNAVKRHFGGDIFRLIRAYFQAMADVERVTQCDIVGHFDLITKFNEGYCLFDENDPRYRKAGLDAIDALLAKDVIFEVNTGAVARGYRRIPYPSPYFLRYIAQKRGNIVLSSDAHSKENLLYGFDMARNIAVSSGVGSILSMTKSGWKRCKIQ